MAFEAVLTYIRTWFPSSDKLSRKRRGSDLFNSDHTPKCRKVLSPMSNNQNLYEAHSTPVDKRLNSSKNPIYLLSQNLHSRKSWRTANKEDDVILMAASESDFEKYNHAKKKGISYMSSTLTPILANGGNTSGRKKTPSKPLNAKRMSNINNGDCFRLDDKEKYDLLLENSIKSNSSSFYGTPPANVSSRSRRLVELTRPPGANRPETVDLTDAIAQKLSTKDRVIKVLDDFEDEIAVLDDSDSDVEVLPTPPSPKPDIKVDPVNSLKVIFDTCRSTDTSWIEGLTKCHEDFVKEKCEEVRTHASNSTALGQINNDLLIKSLSKRVQESLAIKDTILSILETEEDTVFPEITEQDQRAIRKACRGGDPNEVLTKKFNLNVSRRDMQTLEGLNWLNDNVINFYMNLIIERGTDSKWPKAYAMNTFFYEKLKTSGPESLRRWTRRVDIFAHDFICVPIHLGMHWCMAIINLKEKTIKYYDSMGKANDRCLKALKGYLEYEHQDKKGEPFSTRDFVLESVHDIPQQMNGSDCGMFSCTFAEFATRKAKFSFEQKDMPYLRQKMVLEILNGHLLIQ